MCVCVWFFCECECARVSARTKNNAAPFLRPGLLRWGSVWLVGVMERRVTSPLVLNFSLFSCSDSSLTFLFFFVPADDSVTVIFLNRFFNVISLGLELDECVFLLHRAKYVCWQSSSTFHTHLVAFFFIGAQGLALLVGLECKYKQAKR